MKITMGVASLFLTGCMTASVPQDLTAPASINLTEQSQMQIPTVTQQIFSEQPDFSLRQNQLLVVNVTAEQTFRVTPTSQYAEHTFCLSENTAKQITLANQEQPCFKAPADRIVNVKLVNSQQPQALFVSYDSTKEQWSIQGESCVNCDLKALKLDSYVFKNANLQGAQFQNSTLTQANFEAANLQGADFSNSVANQTNLNQSNLTNTNFESAELKNATFIDALMTQTVLRKADVTGADFTNAKKIDVRFDGAIGNNG